MQRQRGLTLLELLVVLAIIGLSMAAVSLSLRDRHLAQLEREAQRLVAVLEAARAQSRTSGIALIWQVTPEGFVIRPTQTPSALTTRQATWLNLDTQAVVNAQTNSDNPTTAANVVVLGPEPILAPTRITLRSVAATLHIGTNGLQPFQVVP